MPLAVKIAPDLDNAAIAPLADVLVAHGVDGVIATNTTIARDQRARDLPMRMKPAACPGGPLRERATEVVHRLAQHLKGRLPIIGVGGILTAPMRSRRSRPAQHWYRSIPASSTPGRISWELASKRYAPQGTRPRPPRTAPDHLLTR